MHARQDIPLLTTRETTGGDELPNLINGPPVADEDELDWCEYIREWGSKGRRRGRIMPAKRVQSLSLV